MFLLAATTVTLFYVLYEIKNLFYQIYAVFESLSCSNT